MSLAEPLSEVIGATPARAKRPPLERLVINVSHDCNLRCLYCYADTGAYGAPRAKLTDEKAIQIIDSFYSRFESIDAIQLFGGEPFLNLGGIEAVCDYVLEVCAREGAPLPRFTAVTNGTLFSPAVVEIINRYGLTLTVSLDGPPEINDENRVYASGRGSFHHVVETVKKLKAATGQPTQIEGTYTARHLERNFSLADFMRFAAAELDVHFLHMPWIMGGEGYNGTGCAPTEENIAAVTRVFCEAIDASLASLMAKDLSETVLISQIDAPLRAALSERETEAERTHLCPAGSGTISVGVDGKVFPCFMFTNKPQFEFTHVDAFDDAGFDEKREAFVSRLTIPPRDQRTFAMGAACAGHNFDLNGEIDRVSEANRRILSAVHAHAVAQVAALKADEDSWTWVQCKLMLHSLDNAGEFVAPPA